MMGDEDKVISFLKVDTEGAEINSIRNWIIDGLTDQGPTLQNLFSPNLRGPD